MSKRRPRILFVTNQQPQGDFTSGLLQRLNLMFQAMGSIYFTRSHNSSVGVKEGGPP